MGGKTSAKSKNEWIAKAYDRINLTVPKGRKAELQAIAERHGQSVNGFINNLIDKALEREQVQAGGGFGFSDSVQENNCSSRLSEQTRPDCISGQDDEPEFLKTAKRLAAMSPKERDIAMMGTPEQQEAVKEQASRIEERIKKCRNR